MRPILAVLPLTTIRSVPITSSPRSATRCIGDIVEFVALERGRDRLLHDEHLMPHGVSRRHQVGAGVRCVRIGLIGLR